MLTLAERLSRLETIESRDVPVLSVYLDLRPGVTEMRTVTPRLRDLLYPIRNTSGEIGHRAGECLKESVDRVFDQASTLEREVGHGVALFVCPPLGLDEHLVVSHRVWDRAIASDRPYLRPLRAVLDAARPTATVVVDARKTSIMVTALGEMVTYEVIPGEEVRKANFGGWFALEETKSRRGAEHARYRLYRASAERLAVLRRTVGIEAIFVGGMQRTVDEFLGFLGAPDRELLDQTFVVDVHTLSDADLQAQAVELATTWERRRESALADRIIDQAAAGQRAVVGLPGTLSAANHHAVAEILIEGAESTPGWCCTGCSALALHGPVCIICGGTSEPVADIIEELASAVVDDGGLVVHGSGTAIDGDLVGASLRFKP
ncbi:MAG: hypothetical protein ACFCVC_14100 [Acidimicrobiia bacterium]